jgi:hypothetical protein
VELLYQFLMVDIDKLRSLIETSKRYQLYPYVQVGDSKRDNVNNGSIACGDIIEPVNEPRGDTIESIVEPLIANVGN